MEAPSIRTEEVLSHTPWLRGLARNLAREQLGDEARADDPTAWTEV